MAGCCNHNNNFDGMSRSYKRVLYWIIAINGLMFLIEMSAGIGAQSQALQADALDFLGDTLTYGLSLWVIGKSLTLRSNVAMAKGVSLLLMAAWVTGSTIYRFFVTNSPDPMTMGTIAIRHLQPMLSVSCYYEITKTVMLMSVRSGYVAEMMQSAI